jgi:hypothetical protein
MKLLAILAALLALACAQDVDVDSVAALDDNFGPADLDDILSADISSADIDVEAAEPAQDAAAVVEDVEVEQSGCSMCPFVAGCTTGRNLIKSFLSNNDF